MIIDYIDIIYSLKKSGGFNMKKNVLLIILCILLTASIFADTKIYKLGQAQSKRGTVNVDYVNVGKAGKGDYIKLSIKKLKVYANIFLPYDLKDVRRHIDKFAQWRQTAIDNDYYVLNKKIGDLSTIRIDFATIGKEYEIVFLEKRTGLKIVSFSLEQIQAFRDIITDEKIDYVTNKERRRKEKEDELFK